MLILILILILIFLKNNLLKVPKIFQINEIYLYIYRYKSYKKNYFEFYMLKKNNLFFFFFENIKIFEKIK
jgi:hypothetical protein